LSIGTKQYFIILLLILPVVGITFSALVSAKEKSQQGKAYLIKKQDMDTVNLGNFRQMIESYWNEFENS